MTRPSLAGIEQGDHAWEVKCPTCGAAPGRPCYGNGEMPRHMTHGARAAVRLKALTAAVRDVLKAAAPHWENQTRREAKYGRAGSACVCEVCDIMRALAARLDLTDLEGEPT